MFKGVFVDDSNDKSFKLFLTQVFLISLIEPFAVKWFASYVIIQNKWEAPITKTNQVTMIS